MAERSCLEGGEGRLRAATGVLINTGREGE